MTTRFLALSALLFAACGGEEGEKKAKVEACEVPGNICIWSGVAQTAMFSPEGQHRLDSPMYLPQGVSFGADGTPYFPDFNNHRIRQVLDDGMVYTVSGTGMLGDGPIGSPGCYAPTPCDALNSAWNHPTDVAVDPNDPDVVWVAAWHNSRIIRLDLEAGTLEWFAGTGGRQYGGDGGPAVDAVLDLPSSLAFDERTGLLYFSDQANHLIRRINADGTIETIAGTPRSPGFSGDGGPALEAKIHGHTDQKADPGSKIIIDDGILYLADTVNGVIRAIDIDAGTIDTVVGSYSSAGDTELIDADGNPYLVDAGSITGYSGDGGPATEAVFNTPRDIAMSPDGNTMYIADTKNDCVRAVDMPSGTVDTFAGTCGVPGFAGDEGPAAEAMLSQPFGISVDPDGHVYIADALNQVIRRVAVE
ncbi:MAG: DNA-binding beta-propeller fold protein YncE [Myxococcota bacterium]|jgi:DNA-binding beta-propeller fold protein YncE